jgi:hypothetical protein
VQKEGHLETHSQIGWKFLSTQEYLHTAASGDGKRKKMEKHRKKLYRNVKQKMAQEREGSKRNIYLYCFLQP